MVKPFYKAFTYTFKHIKKGHFTIETPFFEYKIKITFFCHLSKRNHELLQLHPCR